MKYIYGYWITPSGELFEVLEQCGHTLYCDYDYADDNGWIAVVAAYEENVGTIPCARFNKDNVNKNALRTLKKYISKHPKAEHFQIERVWGDDNYYPMNGENRKRGVLNYLQELINFIDESKSDC